MTSGTVRAVETWLKRNGFGRIESEESLSGGSICSVSRLHLDSGVNLVLKSHDSPPVYLFQAEAAGLNAIAVAGVMRVPAVVYWDETFLLLEDLGRGERGPGYWEQLGRGLAKMHALQQPLFGFHRDTYCGPTRQTNTPTKDGHDFFAQHRILLLTRKAFDRGLLESSDVTRLETIAGKLKELIPEQPAALLHGDLWSGNVHCDSRGNAALIDPAAHWGWAEADLAMTRLFGGFEPAFYESYAEESGLPSDWEKRVDIYNLYHLLNHLLIFGKQYRDSLRSICQRHV